MIKVIYNKVCGCCVQSEPLTSGMVGQPIHFEYSHDFDGLAVTAVFTDGKNTVDVVNPGNECIIPHEVLTTVGAAVKVGIYAVRGNELVIPTVYATIGVVQKGADPSGDVSADPTLPVWAQIQGIIGNLNDLTTEAKNNLVAAINEAAQSGGGGGGGGSSIALDTTLTQSGKAADAKAVGDALAGKQDTLIQSGASVDQIAKIAAVDENGKPTAWKATDMQSSVQPDWNQNDATQPDYVKNRPFYSQHEEGYLIENKSVSIESATELVYVRGDVAYLPFSVGETYKVTWDGVEYSCTANSIGGQVYIGNAELAGASGGNNEPFIIMHYNGDYVLAGAVGEHNFSISGGIERITKLPSKFLPPAEDYIPSSYAKTMEIFFSAPIEQLIEAEQHFKDNGVLYLGNRLVLNMTESLSTIGQVTFYTQEAAYTFKSDGTYTTSYTLENNVRHNSDGSPNGIILNSKDSSKQFIITVDDNGTISATEVTA